MPCLQRSVPSLQRGLLSLRKDALRFNSGYAALAVGMPLWGARALFICQVGPCGKHVIKLILLKCSDREDHALNSLACLMLDLSLTPEMFSTGRQCKGKIYQIWPFCRSQDHSCGQLGFTNDLLVRIRSLSKCKQCAWY